MDPSAEDQAAAIRASACRWGLFVEEERRLLAAAGHSLRLARDTPAYFDVPLTVFAALGIEGKAEPVSDGRERVFGWLGAPLSAGSAQVYTEPFRPVGVEPLPPPPPVEKDWRVRSGLVAPAAVGGA
jgi:hypothetical protein